MPQLHTDIPQTFHYWDYGNLVSQNSMTSHHLLVPWMDGTIVWCGSQQGQRPFNNKQYYLQ